MARSLTIAAFLFTALAFTACSGADSSSTGISDGTEQGPGGKADNSGEGEGAWEPYSVEAFEDALLDSVWEVHTVHTTDLLTSIRLFETGGGDPAFNGNYLLLNANGFGTESLTWDLDINVNTVESVKYDDATKNIVIETLQDDGQGAQDAVTFYITLDMTDGYQVGETLLVTDHPDLDPWALTPSTEPGFEKLGNILSVQSVAAPEGYTVGRIFELGGGDPAMNGTQVLLNLTAFDPSNAPKSFDTKLDIYGVTTVEHDSEKPTFIITADADAMDEDGVVMGETQQYELRYSSQTLDNGTVNFGDHLVVERIK